MSQSKQHDERPRLRYRDVTFLQYFSASYAELRDKFLVAADAAGAGVEHFECPAPGPQGEPLHTDVARLGPEGATRVLVLVAGTHGVEGYSGSGCLTAWLHSTVRSPLPHDCAVLLINLLNPYGAAWLRRQNEANVDVNRNFIDHSVRPTNEAYAALHAALVPRDLEPATLAKADAEVRAYRETVGDAAYWRAYGGQYTHPDGVFYGGDEPAWSNLLLQRILQYHCRHASEIAFIDFHSGLGPFGHGTIIAADRTGSRDFARAKSWYGDALISLAGIDSADGTEAETATTEGHTMDCVAALFPDRTVTCTTLEFGTFPFDDCIPQMRAEAWLHLHGDPLSPEGEKIRAEWLQVFYPDTPDWLEMIWRRSDQVIRQAVSGLTSADAQRAPRSGADFAVYFARDYAEARAKFRRAADKQRIEWQSFVNPQRGPDGEELSTDIVFAGPHDARKLLVVLSGTHGVELFGGAGCQTGWLSRYAADSLPEGTAVLLIHTVNPYGAAWCRRCNENNVDLNRNFVDHSEPHFVNPYYADIHDWLAVAERQGPLRERARQRLAEYRETRGEQAYQVGFLGQYTHPDGFYFGGTEPAWSNRTLRRIIDTHCRGREQVAVIDLHTGLGPFGYGMVGILATPGSEEAARARRWYGRASTLFAEAGDCAGYLDYSRFEAGFLLQAFHQELGDASLTLGGIEFGTYPLDTITEAEVDELWLYNHPDAGSREASAIRAELLRVYYPDSPDWHEMVWWRFKQVVDQALQGLADAR